ncbi:hypothetical protein A2U01_0094707, partial [Trifolium medium]|nr:hypothetical protein [Trifolium medium]
VNRALRKEGKNGTVASGPGALR